MHSKITQSKIYTIIQNSIPECDIWYIQLFKTVFQNVIFGTNFYIQLWVSDSIIQNKILKMLFVKSIIYKMLDAN